jgi:hypothetical protein
MDDPGHEAFLASVRLPCSVMEHVLHAVST